MPPRRATRTRIATSSPEEDTESPAKRRKRNERSTPAESTRRSTRRGETARDALSVSSRASTPASSTSNADGGRSTRQTARRTGKLPPRESVTVEVIIPPREDARVGDSSGDEPGIGEAGPGPRTTRNLARMTREKQLQPVPQPSPSAFKPFMRGDQMTSQMDSIVDFSSPPEGQTQPPRGVLRVVDGEEAFVVTDSEEEETPEQHRGSDSPEAQQPIVDPDEESMYRCRWVQCAEVLDSAADLSRHLRAHADMIAPSEPPSQSSDTAEVIGNLERQLERSQTREELLSRKARDEAAALQQQVRALEGTNELHSATVADFQARLRAAELGCSERDAAVTKLRQDLENVRRQMMTAAADPNSTAELAAAKEKIAQVEAEKKGVEEKLLSAGEEIAVHAVTIDALERKIKLYEEEVKADALPSLSQAEDISAEDKIQERDALIAALRKRNKDLNRAVKATKADVAFFRDQYQIASTSAVEEVRRSRQLNEDTNRLREQLSLGLKQRDLVAAAAVERHKQHAEQLRLQVSTLLEQSRRTDDTIRRKAARYPLLLKENKELETELHNSRSRADKISKRNTELLEQVALFRGRLLGAFEPPSESDSEDEAPAAPPAMPMLVQDDDKGSVGVPDATLGDGGIEAFRCKWALEDGTFCTEIFQTRDEVEEHGLGHVRGLELQA